jgi:hypothetical protein
MNRSVVMSLVVAYAKNLSDDEILSYETDLIEIIDQEKTKRGIKK